jgi:putative glutamine amidotransferase
MPRPPVVAYVFGVTDPLVVQTEAALREPLQRAGAVPVSFPRATRPEDVDALLEHVDGVLLSGGRDMNPETYGAEPHAATRPIPLAHDRFELALVRRALDRGLPVLGVCRGAQVVAVACGGTLIQDLASERPGAIRHSWPWVELAPAPPGEHWHDVAVEPGSLAAAWLGGRPRVNSFHHQAVDRVPDGFAITARAPDGIVEAIEWTGDGTWAVGVQWHQEYMWRHDARHERPFAALVAVARERLQPRSTAGGSGLS